MEALQLGDLLTPVTAPALKDFCCGYHNVRRLGYPLMTARSTEFSVGRFTPKFKKEITHVDT